LKSVEEEGNGVIVDYFQIIKFRPPLSLFAHE